MQNQMSGNCKEETISTLYYRTEMSHRLEATNQMLVELNGDRLEAIQLNAGGAQGQHVQRFACMMWTSTKQTHANVRLGDSSTSG